MSEVFRSWLLRLSFTSADVYLVQSNSLQKWLAQHCPKPSYGFLNGIHLDRIPAAEFTPPEGITGLIHPLGLTIGALGTHKGTPQIMELLSRLREKGVHLGWVFVGIGDTAAYRQKAEDLSIADRTLFTDAVSDEVKWQYLLYADFYCLPSDAEGQPISILEAMSVGLPIIATEVGSIPEIVADGETGFTIPVNDPDALDQAITAMLPDDHRKVMGAAAKQYLIQNHDINALFEKLGNVYRLIYQRMRR